MGRIIVLAAIIAWPATSEDRPFCADVDPRDFIFLGRFLGALQTTGGGVGRTLTYEVLEPLSGPAPAERVQRLIEVQAAEWPESPIHVVIAEDLGAFARIRDGSEGDPFLAYLREVRNKRQPATVSVTVLDGAQPLEGARVSLHGVDGPEKTHATTGPGGAAEFLALAPGRYRIAASKPGYDSHAEPDETVVTFGSCMKSSVSLSPKNALSGVLLGDDGEPIPDVEMHLFDANPEEEPDSAPVPIAVSVTDARGAFRFALVASGRYRLSANGHASSTGTLVIPTFYPASGRAEGGRVFDLRPGSEHLGLVFRIAGMGRRTLVTITARTADGTRLPLHHIPFTLRGPAGRSVASCCSASPRLGPIPDRHELLLFENLSYDFDAFVIGTGSSCYRSLPLHLPKGPKPSRLELSFRPVPHVADSFGQLGCP